ncbi:MAG: hypothetical protein HOH90_00915, partial [Candidatus Marinimicrobia bacterium]|nr:hypothetical protein [Candidatus Neomarinimicrobiota bacterium]
MAKKTKLLTLLLPILLMASGGYDHGTSAGKGNWDISLTWNPFNYFEQGQSYIVLGYGLTKRLDIHGYYSATHNGGNNYYGGLSYQFLNTPFLDLSTAVGMRAYTDNSNIHLFFPQLLYTVKLSKRIGVGGSFVDVRSASLFDNSTRDKDTSTGSVQRKFGVAKDVFLMVKLDENKKYRLDFTVGGFNPVFWEPESGDWYPTYSLD